MKACSFTLEGKTIGFVERNAGNVYYTCNSGHYSVALARLTNGFDHDLTLQLIRCVRIRLLKTS